MAPTDGFMEATFTDHQFAAWLRKHGWRGGYHHSGTGTIFHGADPKKTLAVAFYNNTACTKRVYINN